MPKMITIRFLIYKKLSTTFKARGITKSSQDFIFENLFPDLIHGASCGIR